MNNDTRLSKQLGKRYWMWHLYHFLVADAISIQRPTKYKWVRNFLGDGLEIAADIGCGPGVFERHMSARAKYLIAMDIDRESLARVRSRHLDLKNIGFVTASADRLPLHDEAVDTVLFLEVLEHVNDDRAVLREIYRVLRPGGKLVLSVPVPPGEVNEDSAWGHKREGYLLPEITELLASSGLEVQKFAFAEFEFSRRAARMIRWWRVVTRLPAPILISWIAYLDLFSNSAKAQTGSHCPATVLLLAQKKRTG